MRLVIKFLAAAVLNTVAVLAMAEGLDSYKAMQLPEAPRAEAGKGVVTVLFMGVTTLLFDDGETALLTDGYFSRPPLNQWRSVEPDRAVITKSLNRAGIKKLAAVLVTHAHIDHALDSPRVAQDTGALLVGSESAANIGRGQGLAESSIKVVKDGDSLTFGNFKVSFITSAHLPITFATGDITEPLRFPAPAKEMKAGEAFSILIEHSTGGRFLVQGSAGFMRGALQGKKADVVFLGIGGLGGRREEYKEGYWMSIVKAVGATRVIPVHWDNFYLPLDSPLVPAADFGQSMEALTERGKRDDVEIRLQTEWRWVAPMRK
jgi:L-ascorbate metabolism protein UlaG (beta-lactamase superfamily)